MDIFWNNTAFIGKVLEKIINCVVVRNSCFDFLALIIKESLNK